MVNTRTIALTAVAGLLVVLAWRIWGGGGAATPDLPLGEPDVVPDVANSESTRVSPLTAARTSSADSHGAIPALTDADAFREESVRVRDVTARKMEAAWNRDAAAPQQAMETEQRMLEAVLNGLASQARYQPAAYNMSCRATMCRIEGEFVTGTEGNNWTTRLLLDMGGTFGNSTTLEYPLSDGGSQLVLYAFRLGSAPPQ